MDFGLLFQRLKFGGSKIPRIKLGITKFPVQPKNYSKGKGHSSWDWLSNYQRAQKGRRVPKKTFFPTLKGYLGQTLFGNLGCLEGHFNLEVIKTDWVLKGGIFKKKGAREPPKNLGLGLGF